MITERRKSLTLSTANMASIISPSMSYIISSLLSCNNDPDVNDDGGGDNVNDDDTVDAGDGDKGGG